MSARGDQMSNIFDAHPWMNGAAGALCMALTSAVIGKVRKLLTSPGRRDFQALESRLTKKLEEFELRMAGGFTGIYTRLDEKTDALTDRIDEKTDALDKRIDEILLRGAGGR